VIPHSSTFDIETQRLDWIKDNPHVCIAPYQEFQYRRNQKNPCCQYRGGLISDGSLTATVTSNIESGRIDPNCRVCREQENNSQMSHRVRGLLDASSEKLTKFINTKTVDEFTMTLMASNKCNMACRTCNPASSSLIAQMVNDKIFMIPSTISDDPVQWTNIKNDIRAGVEQYEIYRITVLGGEGTVQDDLFDLLNWLIEEQLSNKITLTIGTNGSVFLKEQYELWCQQFKFVTFAISIDGVHDNSYYVRWPVKFDKLHQNLADFTELVKTYNNCHYYLTPTFYVNNICYVKEYLDYFELIAQTGYIIAIYDNTLFDPEYYSIRNLPTYIKKQIHPQLESVLNTDYHILAHNNVFKISLINLAKQLEQNLEQTPAELLKQQSIWQKYLQETAWWDYKTKTSITIQNSQLWGMLSNADQELYHTYYNQL
jgi:hypothetical protein